MELYNYSYLKIFHEKKYTISYSVCELLIIPKKYQKFQNKNVWVGEPAALRARSRPTAHLRRRRGAGRRSLVGRPSVASIRVFARRPAAPVHGMPLTQIVDTTTATRLAPNDVR